MLTSFSQYRAAGALCIAVLIASTFLSPAADPDGFTPLFDGKSLNGWEGNTSLWSVRDGAITGETKADTQLKHNTFLVWKGGTVDDFELRLSYRIVNGNSGIQYRSRVLEQGPQGPIVGGYQADFEAGKTYSGILYEERGRGILAQRGQKTRIVPTAGGKHRVEVVETLGKSDEIQAGIKSEDWNDYVVLAQGNRLIHSINGRVTADVTDEDTTHAAKSGVLALQVHQGPPMTVQVKNIRLKKLPAGAGGAAAAAGTDLEKIRGDWIGIAGIADGQELPLEAVSSLQLQFIENKYDIQWADGGDKGRFTLTESTTPRQIDVESDTAGSRQGIYELTDKELRISYGIEGGARPKDFNAGSGSAAISVTYKRR